MPLRGAGGLPPAKGFLRAPGEGRGQGQEELGRGSVRAGGRRARWKGSSRLWVGWGPAFGHVCLPRTGWEVGLAPLRMAASRQSLALAKEEVTSKKILVVHL